MIALQQPEGCIRIHDTLRFLRWRAANSGQVFRCPSGSGSFLDKPKLPLSCGQRVTFFAGTKKVTKEMPFRI